MMHLWYWPGCGWDFKEWRELYGKNFNPPRTPQSERAYLHPILATRGGRKIETKAGWERGRKVYLDAFKAFIGEFPAPSKEASFWEIDWVKDGGAYTIEHGVFPGEEGERIPALRLVPKDLTKPRPAVLAWHQTVPQSKEEPCGIESDPTLAYGKHLAERGFIVLAPDAVGFGERSEGTWQEFFARSPRGSVAGKMIYDFQRAVDALQAMPEVKPDLIGSIGHSHGGYGTLFGMVFDPRVKAGVISCGFNTLRDDPSPFRWWQSTALIPRLGLLRSVSEAPFDFHHLLALIAPRALYIPAGMQDECFPNTISLPGIGLQLKELYSLIGAPEEIVMNCFPGAHEFPPSISEEAYGFLARRLSDS